MRNMQIREHLNYKRQNDRYGLWERYRRMFIKKGLDHITRSTGQDPGFKYEL